mmetsp:Transcript_40455/g.115303  ORF Transcript_40455/g.115303 Transcript_40455/m.115303 type:complete len:242 (-) Transcript_40455:2208-2933(-)
MGVGDGARLRWPDSVRPDLPPAVMECPPANLSRSSPLPPLIESRVVVGAGTDTPTAGDAGREWCGDGGRPLRVPRKGPGDGGRPCVRYGLEDGAVDGLFLRIALLPYCSWHSSSLLPTRALPSPRGLKPPDRCDWPSSRLRFPYRVPLPKPLVITLLFSYPAKARDADALDPPRRRGPGEPFRRDALLPRSRWLAPSIGDGSRTRFGGVTPESRLELPLSRYAPYAPVRCKDPPSAMRSRL